MPTKTPDKQWVSDDTDFAPAWKPGPGDVIEGKVALKDLGYSDAYPTRLYRRDFSPGEYPIVTLEHDDGSRTAVHCFNAQLARVLWGYAIGTEVRVTYLEKIDTGNGQTMARFRFEHADAVATERPF